MNIELVEFYPLKNKIKHKSGWSQIGTVHVYLIDHEMDLRGIIVIKNGQKYRFYLPNFQAIDEETGEKVRYPLIRFIKEEKHQALIDFLHKNVIKYVKEKLKLTKQEDNSQETDLKNQ